MDLGSDNTCLRSDVQGLFYGGASTWYEDLQEDRALPILRSLPSFNTREDHATDTYRKPNIVKRYRAISIADSR
jgi:hypothetical protein